MSDQEWKPVQCDDIWFRVVTGDDYIDKKTGRLHNRAFSGKTVSPPTRSRPWAFEISGRALSLTVDVVAEGRAFVETIVANKPDAVFAGAVYAPVKEIRSEVGTAPTVAVAETPLPTDSAHADIVVFTDQELGFIKQLIRDLLQDRTTFLPAEQCGQLDELREAIPREGATAASRTD